MFLITLCYFVYSRLTVTPCERGGGGEDWGVLKRIIDTLSVLSVCKPTISTSLSKPILISSIEGTFCFSATK